MSNSRFDHHVAMAERFRQKLLFLVLYIKRTVDSLHHRETSLASLIAYLQDSELTRMSTTIQKLDGWIALRSVRGSKKTISQTQYALFDLARGL